MTVSLWFSSSSPFLFLLVSFSLVSFAFLSLSVSACVSRVEVSFVGFFLSNKLPMLLVHSWHPEKCGGFFPSIDLLQYILFSVFRPLWVKDQDGHFSGEVYLFFSLFLFLSFCLSFFPSSPQSYISLFLCALLCLPCFPLTYVAVVALIDHS